jgi:hypothetical protein
MLSFGTHHSFCGISIFCQGSYANNREWATKKGSVLRKFFVVSIHCWFSVPLLVVTDRRNPIYWGRGPGTVRVIFSVFIVSLSPVHSGHQVPAKLSQHFSRYGPALKFDTCPAPGVISGYRRTCVFFMKQKYNTTQDEVLLPEKTGDK